MITVDTVKECVSKYKVSSSGTVVEKDTNKEIKDETLKMIIKTSFLVYSNAKHTYDLYKHMGVRQKPGIDAKTDYISLALKKYGVNGEITDFKENKMMQAIMQESPYQVGILSNTLEGYEYDVFLKNNHQYGMACLRYIARNQGKDFSDVNISIDTSNFQKNGVSDITVVPKAKTFEPLKEEMSYETLENMGEDLRIAYLETKASEYRHLGDIDAANYYQANAERLKKLKEEYSKDNEEVDSMQSGYQR